MTVLAANIVVKAKDPGTPQSYEVVASDIIYKGALLMVNAAGYVAPCTATASTMFAGIAQEKIDNSSGSAGDVSVVCYRTGRFLLLFSDTLTIANVGDVAYAEDDQTCSVSGATNEHKVGVIAEFVDATHAWVQIDDGTANPELSA